MTSENFKEFKKVIQGDKLERRKKKLDWWHAPFTFISRYTTWILVKTRITANFITITGVLIGLIGLFLIAFGSKIFIIIGFILLYIYYISDEMDGEVARYKKQTSLRGIYYDQVGHLIFLWCFFSSFGYSIFRSNSEFLYIILGFSTSYFLLGIRSVRKTAIVASSKSKIKRSDDRKQELNQIESSRSFFKVIKKIIMNLTNAFSHTHIITILFLIGNLIFIYFGNLQILEILMICYFVFLLIAFSLFIVIRAKSIENDVKKIHNKILDSI
jgi:phosphatidylglycerophosphate synthase